VDAIIVGVDHDHRWRGVVGHREVEHLGAGLAGRHRADADVVAAVPATGGDHVPGGRFQAQLDAQFVGHCLGHVDVEAIELVLLVEEREWRIVFHQHVDQLAVLLDALEGGAGQGQVAEGGEGQAEGGEQSGFHRDPWARKRL